MHFVSKISPNHVTYLKRKKKKISQLINLTVDITLDFSYVELRQLGLPNQIGNKDLDSDDVIGSN